MLWDEFSSQNRLVNNYLGYPVLWSSPLIISVYSFIIMNTLFSVPSNAIASYSVSMPSTFEVQISCLQCELTEIKFLYHVI